VLYTAPVRFFDIDAVFLFGRMWYDAAYRLCRNGLLINRTAI
jgi:hypothetical protein